MLSLRNLKLPPPCLLKLLPSYNLKWYAGMHWYALCQGMLVCTGIQRRPKSERQSFGLTEVRKEV